MILNFEEENIVFVYYKIRFDKDRIVECVKYYVKENSFFKYYLFSNNCEYFVIYCVIGYRFSLQVLKFKFVFGMFL